MITSTREKIAILGMSDKPERYSNKAYKKLMENNYSQLTGISPKKIKVDDLEVVESLKDVASGLHTLTLYVGAERLELMIEDILKLSPVRIICNPGTENPNLISQAREQGIDVVEGCTLIMLDTEQF